MPTNEVTFESLASIDWGAAKSKHMKELEARAEAVGIRLNRGNNTVEFFCDPWGKVNPYYVDLDRCIDCKSTFRAFQHISKKGWLTDTQLGVAFRLAIEVVDTHK